MRIRLDHPCGLSHPDGANHYFPLADHDVAAMIKGFAASSKLEPDQVLVYVLDLDNPKQADAIHGVIRRQGAGRLRAITPPTPLCPWVGLDFEHIYVGVEPNGYAHT